MTKNVSPDDFSGYDFRDSNVESNMSCAVFGALNVNRPTCRLALFWVTTFIRS